jgi:hypothetical protein
MYAGALRLEARLRDDSRGDCFGAALTRGNSGGDARVMQVARAAIDGAPDRRQDAIDAVCACWARTRAIGLGDLIRERRWVASKPDSLLVRSALQADRADACAGSAALVTPLLHVLQDEDPQLARVAARARQAERREWLELVVGTRHRRRLDMLSADRWPATIELLDRDDRRDDELLATGGDHGRDVRLWRTRDGAAHATLWPRSARVERVAFSPDGGMVATGGNGLVRLWRTADGACETTFDVHGIGVTSLACGPTGDIEIEA